MRVLLFLFRRSAWSLNAQDERLANFINFNNYFTLICDKALPAARVSSEVARA